MAGRRLLALLGALALTATACSDDPGDGASDGTDAGAPAASAEPSRSGASGTVSIAGAEEATSSDVGGAGSSADPSDSSVSSDSSARAPVSASAPPTTPPAPAETTTTPAPATTTSTTTTTIDPAVPPRVDAAAWTIYDMRTGDLLASNQATARRPVGSLMKLLTAQVAYDAGDPTKMVVAPNDGLVLSADESVIDIRGGQELSRDLLIRAMLKASANDAARLLALDIAGSEAAFAELMNARAASLGLNDTHAVNATGLDAEGQYSSAYDMTMLGARLMGSINFQIAVRDPTAELNGQAYPNTNDLLGVYPGADGIKTGRTSGAGWCILASAIRDGRRLVVAVLGAPTEEARNAAAMTLLDWGFAQPA